MKTKFQEFINESMINNINKLQVGDLVVMNFSVGPEHKDIESSSIINNYAIVTHIPENANFVYGRFVNGGDPMKIKNNNVNWKLTNELDDYDKEYYKNKIGRFGKHKDFVDNVQNENNDVNRYRIVSDYGHGDKSWVERDLTKDEVKNYFVKHRGWTEKDFDEVGIEYFMDSDFGHYVEIDDVNDKEDWDWQDS